jgi:hypothetical protein
MLDDCAAVGKNWLADYVQRNTPTCVMADMVSLEDGAGGIIGRGACP